MLTDMQVCRSSWRYYRRIVPGRELKPDRGRDVIEIHVKNLSATALWTVCTRETWTVGYSINTHSYANTRDREGAEHHEVHNLQLPAHRTAGLGGLLPPGGVGLQVGGQVVRTPLPAAVLSETHYSSSSAHVWNCERSVGIHLVILCDLPPGFRAASLCGTWLTNNFIHFSSKTQNIDWSELFRSEYLMFFFVMYDSKLKMFRLWQNKCGGCRFVARSRPILTSQCAGIM